MPVIKCSLGNKHATLRAEKVGPITLLQDHNGISHMAVRKVNPEVGLVGRPPLAYRHWAPEARAHRWEGKSIGLSLPRGQGGGRLNLPLKTPAHNVMSLKMCDKKPLRQPHSALWELYPLTQSIPVGWTDPRHLLRVRRLQKSARDMPGSAGHVHRLPHVCTET